MSIRIIPAVSSLLVAAFLLGGCIKANTPPPLPEMTQLQVRQMQTREYQSGSEKEVMKALVAALLDEGYIVSSADMDLGLISAAKESYELDEDTKNFMEFNYGVGKGTYQTTKRLEASTTVRQHNDVIRVRVNIIAKALNNNGGIIWSQPVYDLETYQRLFSKVDKAVFLEREKI
ncbi:hypothetical protein [Salidesulfovibrio onnuriiensis]|uniref:hypothetical protein n=1 Tax=Salidesulfovibrio onnuriiensis TaxID=2583823 RepID=UPI001C9D30B1|nr:hypothetical protein [Salidesulfovibrio onnuriiensis]